ncbi:hypothetical protein GF340_00105 [Candidatus Peregrinibacteria bacterium]|nr:hypothetical protein [Candidatus Peregrinibacteria bacterium]
MKKVSSLRLKFLALIAAIILWFVVITVENTVYKFPEQISVEVQNLEPGLSFEGKPPRVEVYLRVDKEDLKKLTAKDFDIHIDMENAIAGQNELPVIATSENSLARILKVEPTEVTVNVSQTIEKTVPIEVQIEGEPAEGYIVENFDNTYKSAQISGAKNLVDQIDNLIAKVRLNGNEINDLNQTVSIELPASSTIPTDLMTIDPSQMAVEVIIESATAEKAVNVQPFFRTENERILWQDKVLVEPETITITGNKNTLDNLTSITTMPFEMTRLIRGEAITVPPDLPDGITNVNETAITLSLPEDETTDLSDGPTI